MELRPHSAQVDAQGRYRRLREWHPAILVPLAATYDDLSTVKIYVLDSQTQALEETQPAPIHQNRTQSRNTAHS